MLAENKRLKKIIEQTKPLVEALKYYAKPAFCRPCMLPVERGDTAREALSAYKKIMG